MTDENEPYFMFETLSFEACYSKKDCTHAILHPESKCYFVASLGKV